MARLRNTIPLLGVSTEVPVFKSRPITTAFLGTDNAVSVKVGDIVHFDWGGANWGFIKVMVWNRGGEVLFIENDRGFVGEYIAGRTEFRFPAEYCYIVK
jgi:hypothetical protein